MSEIAVSRKKNTIKSVVLSGIYNIVRIILQFVFRSVFIYYLSIEYLGLNSAISGILNILSVSELGLSTVITCNLFKPVSENDTDKINAIIKYYRKLYTIVGIVILSVGLGLMPFLKLLIKDSYSLNINIYIVYLVSLSTTVLSYLCAYRNVLFTAYQHQYKASIINMILNIVCILGQLISIVVFKNYYVYLAFCLALSVLSNVIMYCCTLKIYPNIRVKNANKLTQTDKKDIFTNIKGMFYHKISQVVLQGTDSVVISAFVGVTILGIYSNYSIFTSNLILVFSILSEALIGSVGNMIAEGDNEKSYRIFQDLKLIFFWLSGFCSICLLILLNPTISIWSQFGKWDTTINWKFNFFTVLIIVLNFYLYSSRIITGTFRTAIGHFEKDRFKGVIEALINIVISLIFVKIWGIAGVLIGTIISCLCTSLWIDPYMVYKYEFKKPLKTHFYDLLKYFFATLLVGGITYLVCYFIPETNISWYVLKVATCAILPNLLFLCCFLKTAEFKDITGMFKAFILKRKNKENTI